MLEISYDAYFNIPKKRENANDENGRPHQFAGTISELCILWILNFVASNKKRTSKKTLKSARNQANVAAYYSLNFEGLKFQTIRCLFFF